ncbi:MAG TPA: uroporphyrinogen-III C-methyltransferase [Bryobacteraceae bacterium]|nr:uroporphyrinogen-III C-methyltransferase [Bryobacteraceae bacterium]
MTPGKVYLVGAGPGHPELLTVKAVKLLETCDVIVYDRLVQEEVLAIAKSSAERIYLGKSVGSHESRQDEIHELLVAKAREGKMVVRLKGGDPFLFGRGGEEAEYLADREIPFEVVPGVSSALAAPLSAGIPVTHREAGSAVAIVTGHEANREHSRLNWKAFAGVDTLVFLMAVSGVERIAAELIAHGRSPETPAAMIQMAFWHGEQVVTATLATIAAEVARAGINPPATLVVGEVVRMRGKLRGAQRDLRRRPDSSPAFQPAPSPEQLLRIATGGIGTQVLRFALATSLFDRLAEWKSASELARELGLNRMGLAEVLECLVSMGLLEASVDGYRNLELASRYLVKNSPQSLRPALLYHGAQTMTLSSVGTYVLNGRQDIAANDPSHLREASCECLARYALPYVAEKLDLTALGSGLFVGWGGRTFHELASNRWPNTVWNSCNPFESREVRDPASAIGLNGCRYGAVVLSGLLECCERQQFGPVLKAAAGGLTPDGLLIVHDSFLSSNAVTPQEAVLSAFGRHVVLGGSRNWSQSRILSELENAGLRVERQEPIPGGTQLIVARPM